MKLAIVTNAFPRCRFELFERLARDNNHNITIFKYADWWDAESKWLEVKKWQAVGFKLPFMTDDVYFHFDPRVLWAITHGDWEVIIAYGYGSLTTYLVALVAKLRRIPFILWSDARLEYELRCSSLRLWTKSLLHRLSVHFIASGTSALLFLQWMGIHQDNITVSPYAINNEALYRNYLKWQSISSDIRSELGISRDAVVILYVGRLVREKGIEELIASFARLPDKQKCALVLVGDGKDLPVFKTMVKEMNLSQVIFVGRVPHDLVAKYYAIGDIFVLPSYKDVWGLVVNEAMVCGLPIVTTYEVGAWRDLVKHGENGFVIPARDVKALIEALQILCRDPKLRKTMGQRSYEIIQQWDLRHAVDSVELALKKIRNG